jgi:hypothetical protein
MIYRLNDSNLLQIIDQDQIIIRSQKSSLLSSPDKLFFLFFFFCKVISLRVFGSRVERTPARESANGGGSEIGGWGGELLRLAASVSHPYSTERSRERERRLPLASDSRPRAEVYSGRWGQMVSRMVWFSLQLKFHRGNLLNFGVNFAGNSHRLRF